MRAALKGCPMCMADGAFAVLRKQGLAAASKKVGLAPCQLSSLILN